MNFSLYVLISFKNLFLFIKLVVRASGTRKLAIDKCDGRGETALHKAAIKGDVQLVKSLLRRGANPNRQDYAGMSFLCFFDMLENLS